MNSFVEREPSKRRIKPPTEPVIDFEFGESSDDSDFNIDEHNDVSDDSFNSEDDNDDKSSISEKDSEEDDDTVNESLANLNNKSVSELLSIANKQTGVKDVCKLMICCVCLGDRSDHVNEIVECDKCGVTVHELCYGVSDATSVTSSDSLAPTEPWFCEPCRANVIDPNCELCPNTGGIFKITDVGKWVHLVCALYIPGVAFGEVDKLTNVTLFEMPYNKWGCKLCGLCADKRLARCGVQIPCDAGMCKQFFHVTCAQREGLLSEAHSDEVDHADPFYAHCKLHTEKTVMRRRKNNYMLLAVRQAQRKKELESDLASPTPATIRIERKLERKRQKYIKQRQSLVQPWVPTQKMPRLLTTCASACKALWRKAELMGIDVLAVESREAQNAALQEISNKWHIPPSFSVEFTAYFLDRNLRIPSLKSSLEKLLEENTKLAKEHEDLDKRYESVIAAKQECEGVNAGLREVIEQYHQLVKLVVPNKRLPIIQDIILNARSAHGSPAPLMVPTAAALKAGVGYPILRTNYKGHQQTEPRIHSKQEPNGVTCHECGICRSTKEQHLLALCDKCQLYYHLGCLNPPLTRMPKKTKQVGWHCSECDKESSPEQSNLMSGPRKARYKPPPTLPEEFYPQYSEHKREKKKKKKKIPPPKTPSVPVVTQQENFPHIKIKIKAIHSSDGNAAGTTFVSSCQEVDPLAIDVPPVVTKKRPKSVKQAPDPLEEESVRPKRSKPLKEAPASNGDQCDTCLKPGDKVTLVRCDECMRSFHFGCLEPPLKKSPKVRGYSWHCADCDPTDSEKK